MQQSLREKDGGRNGDGEEEKREAVHKQLGEDEGLAGDRLRENPLCRAELALAQYGALGDDNDPDGGEEATHLEEDLYELIESAVRVPPALVNADQE